MSDQVSDFIDAMRAAGVVPAEPIAGKLLSGRIIRFRCEGDGTKRNGWARFFEGEPAGGSFGNHKQNTGTLTWSQRREQPLTAAERERLRAQWRAAEAQRVEDVAKAQERARAEAQRIWREAAPASPDHPYAARKRMRVGGLRQADGTLLVPMRDGENVIWNLQRIYPDGAKRFLKGGRILGLSVVIGMRPEPVRGVFAEGYATGEAISQALGDRPVVVAFNTANLAAVVAEWVRRFPRADWVIAADDDHLTGLRMEERGQPYQNPGIDKARAVAAEHGCRVAYPPSVGDRAVGFALAVNIDFSDVLLRRDAGEIIVAFDDARRPAGSAQPSLAERIGRAA